MNIQILASFHKLLFLVLIASFAFSSVPKSFAQSGETKGGVIGGAVGGAIGNLLGRKGDKTLTTIIGIGVGAFVGSRIGKALSKKDRQRMADATHRTVSTGKNQTWAGDNANGHTTLVGSDRRRAEIAVPVLKEKVTQLPPLDFINENYVTLKKDNVLGGPGADYRPVGSLNKNDVVNVTGKVQNQPWYLISQNGAGVGFVSEKSLKPTTAAPTQFAAATGTVENRQTQVQRTCRTVKQTVMVNGKEQAENVTACQTATGWEVV